MGSIQTFPRKPHVATLADVWRAAALQSGSSVEVRALRLEDYAALRALHRQAEPWHEAPTLRQVESRGGAICYLVIGLPEIAGQRQRYGERFYQELLHGVARRLQQLVRPLDILTRLDDNHFGLLALVDDLQACSPSSFKRLHEGLNIKAFKTSEGFISLKAGIGLVSLDASALPIDPRLVIERAESLLPDAYSTGRIVPMRLKQPGG